MEKHGQTIDTKHIGPAAMYDIGAFGRGIPTAKQSGTCWTRTTASRESRFWVEGAEEKITLQVFLSEYELPIAGDPAEIATIFATLVECCSRLAPGGSMTIFTALLHLDAMSGTEKDG